VSTCVQTEINGWTSHKAFDLPVMWHKGTVSQR